MAVTIDIEFPGQVAHETWSVPALPREGETMTFGPTVGATYGTNAREWRVDRVVHQLGLARHPNVLVILEHQI